MCFREGNTDLHLNERYFMNLQKKKKTFRKRKRLIYLKQRFIFDRFIQRERPAYNSRVRAVIGYPILSNKLIQATSSLLDNIEDLPLIANRLNTDCPIKQRSKIFLSS